jgi:hypothetical protein
MTSRPGADGDDATRHDRLTLRHQVHGMDQDQAAAWARTTDQDNALVIAWSRTHADLVITVAGL